MSNFTTIAVYWPFTWINLSTFQSKGCKVLHQKQQSWKSDMYKSCLISLISRERLFRSFRAQMANAQSPLNYNLVLRTTRPWWEDLRDFTFFYSRTEIQKCMQELCHVDPSISTHPCMQFLSQTISSVSGMKFDFSILSYMKEAGQNNLLDVHGDIHLRKQPSKQLDFLIMIFVNLKSLLATVLI